jgi:hypothetical protein
MKTEEKESLKINTEANGVQFFPNGDVLLKRDIIVPI